jgi:hypothetical protein
MTVQEFDATGKYERPCLHCRRLGMARELNEHNQQRVVCPHCGSKTAWGSFNLKQNGRTTRRPYPLGESLDEVWARFDDRCVLCSRTKDELAEQRVGRHRQHVAPYAAHEHQGPIVPICARCHTIGTVLQKDAEIMRAFVRFSRTHAEPISDRGTGVPASRLSPDSVPPSGEAPDGGLEGFSDDDADV